MISDLARLVDLLGFYLNGNEPVEFPELSDSSLALALRQRVGPLLYEVAARSVTPAAIAARAALQPSYYRTLFRNESLLACADRACTLLHNRGLAAVRLKGADLLRSLYGNPALRPMDDIDLLVARPRVEEALGVLERHGFRRPAGQLPLDFYLDHHLHVALVDELTGSYVELHWQLMDPFTRGRLDGAAAVAAAVPLVDSRPELGLKLPASLRYLYLALHVDKHGPFHEVLLRRNGASAALLHPSSEARLLWLFDLALLHRREPISSATVADLARELGVDRGLWTTLSLVAALFGVQSVPAGLVDALRPPPDGMARRVACSIAGLVLDLGAGRGERVLRWAMQMDDSAQVRPLRLLQLPIHLLTPRAHAERSQEGTIRSAVRDLWRVARMASRITRHRVQRGLGGD